MFKRIEAQKTNQRLGDKPLHLGRSICTSRRPRWSALSPTRCSTSTRARIYGTS